MDLEAYLAKVQRIKRDFDAARNELIDYASTKEGRAALDAVDKTVVRKLYSFAADISPTRLVTVTVKLLKRNA